MPAESSSPYELKFPAVTRNIVIRNDGATTIRCGFSALGVSGSAASNYFTLTTNQSFEQDFRVTSVFLISDAASTGTATVVAGLTSIPRSALENNWSGSAGIG